MSAEQDHFRAALAAARCWRRHEQAARVQGLTLREIQARVRVECHLAEARALRARMPGRHGRAAA